MCNMSKKVLGETEYRLAQIVEASPFAIFVIDSNHIITHWNRACAELTGLAAEEMVGTRDSWRAFYRQARPVLADLVVEEAEEDQVRAFYGERVRPSAVDGGWEVVDQVEWCERWLSYTATPLFGIDGKVTGAVETLHDLGAAYDVVSIAGRPKHDPAERAIIRSALAKALEREEFSVQFQPKGRLRDGKVTGFEALLRWTHPSLGAVSPAVFVPMLEETGRIVEVGEWVIGKAVEEAMRWREEGLAVAVNLSARQLWQLDLPSRIERILAEHGATPHCLELDITESMLMRDPEQAVHMLKILDGMGIHLSLDDFGTGYSSLSYLKRFPIRTIKVDRSFVSDITTNRDDLEIVRAILTLGASLGRKIVAEGVETEEQRQILSDLGCDEIQGYLLSRPLTPEELGAFMQRGGRRLKKAG
jgi:PAS domain S-box-containing protein